jgi:hypothetical protein
MRLGSLVCGLLMSIIYLMDFLYFQRGLESRPCREILHIYNACAVLCFFVSQSINGEVPSLPMLPTRYTLQTIVLYFYFVLQVFFKDTLYFLLKYVLPPVPFTLTQVVLLSITSTFTRVQIQSNLGTTDPIQGQGV